MSDGLLSLNNSSLEHRSCSMTLPNHHLVNLLQIVQLIMFCLQI
jgi:hypothetical protein